MNYLSKSAQVVDPVMNQHVWGLVTRIEIRSEGTEERSMARPTRTNSTLTVREVACFLNIHANTVRRWSDLGILKSFCVGPRGDLRFKREDLLAFLPPEARSNRG